MQCVPACQNAHQGKAMKLFLTRLRDCALIVLALIFVITLVLWATWTMALVALDVFGSFVER
jgi:hypothetical protein